MKMKYVFTMFCAFFLCLGLASFVYCQDIPDGNEMKRVLVVHSYHPEYEWVSTISRGIKRVFEKEANVQVETYYMDTKRKTSQEWKEESGQKARDIISEWDPDVVITADDNAQEFVGKFYVGKERPQIVFTGVNAKAEKYGYPATNVTGILERPHFKDTVELLKQVVPNVKKVAFISDNSETSQGAIDYLQEQAQGLGVEIVTIDRPDTFDQWKAHVAACQGQADAIFIYMYHTLKQEGQEESIVPKEIMEWTVEHSAIPIVGFFNFAIDDGALLGIVESGLEHGREAALIAQGLMEGKGAQDFPVKTAEKGIIMLNKTTADKMGISFEKGLKERAEIIVGE